MTFSQKSLAKIARLAYLDTINDKDNKLNDEVNETMNFIEQLSSVDTKNVSPLSHPLALSQRLREDVVTEKNSMNDLANIAPLFDDDLYLVPKVVG